MGTETKLCWTCVLITATLERGLFHQRVVRKEMGAFLSANVAGLERLPRASDRHPSSSWNGVTWRSMAVS